jgi:hypothetical protein
MGLCLQKGNGSHRITNHPIKVHECLVKIQSAGTRSFFFYSSLPV